MDNILITRPQPEAEALAGRLRAEGFAAAAAPLLAYAALDARLPPLSGFQALAFTSARGVAAFAEKTQDRGLPAFCVGAATAQAAGAAGFAAVESAGGDAQDLCALLRARRDFYGIENILHPCGADTAQDLAALLRPAGVAVTRLPVYEARAAGVLPEALRGGRAATVLLFSARAAEHLVRLLQREKTDAAALEAVCISARVAAALDPLPFRAVRVAEKPDTESMLDILKRSLAPESPIDAILTPMTPDDKPHPASGDRRHAPDRRQRRAAPDGKGRVRAEGYDGPDRRAGRDRRAFHERQRDQIWQAKMAFVNRTSVSAAFVFVAAVTAVYFLLAPEIAGMNAAALRMQAMEERMKTMDARLAAAAAARAVPEPSVSSRLSHGIERIENAAGDARGVLNALSGTTAEAAAQLAGDSGVNQLVRLLDNMQSLNRTEGGHAVLSAATEKLKAALDVSGGNAEGLNEAVDVARRQDPALQELLGGVDGKHLGAAAMLLAMGELRAGLGHGRPFEKDLALVRRFAGDDPALRQALDRLAPHAESGVLSRSALQAEFKGLAYDIVSAKLAGEELGVQDAARKRFSRFVQMRRVDDVEGDSVDAAVARAQMMLDAGDVKGALAELRRLDGPPAATAEGWMQQAAGHVAAQESSAALTQAIFGALSAAAAGEGFTVRGVMDALKDSMTAPPQSGASVPYLSPSLQQGRGGLNGGIATFPSE